MRVYFSHPTFTYRTDTEEFCVDMIKERWGNVEKVVNPLEYGLKHDVMSLISSSEKVVGMSVLDKYTFLVWNELERAREEGAEVYTIRVQNKEKIGGIEKGMPEDIVKLSKEESEKFTNELLKENRDGLISTIFGHHGGMF
ncbi:MAG: hypothetical protein ACOCSA_00175 [Candidatus Hadarchaeota archaeon]